MKKTKLLISISILAASYISAQGNYVFSGPGSAGFETIYLNTPGGQTWTTDQGACPVFFSATDTATGTGVFNTASANGADRHYAAAVNGASCFPAGDGNQPGTGIIPLPVLIAGFTACICPCTAQLSFTSADERNAGFFDIEQSYNGIGFSKIAAIPAAGHANTYTITANQEKDIAWYRLKMIDLDGSYKYSNALLLKTYCHNGHDNYIQYYPNPVAAGNGMFTVRYRLGYTGKARFILVNTEGQPVVDRQVIMDKEGLLPIDVSSLPSGAYYTWFVNDGGGPLGAAQRLIRL